MEKCHENLHEQRVSTCMSKASHACVQVFGAIRSLSPFRHTVGYRDYLILGSDSGRIVIVEDDKVSACSCQLSTGLPD